MSLAVEAQLTRGDLSVDVALRVGHDEAVALLGPNGAGKSTFVGMVAGLLPIDSGHVDINGQRVDDPATNTLVPAEARGIGVVFQDRRLFPNMSAIDNVAFGLRCRGQSRAASAQRACAWLERVGLAGRERARPGELSGGEAQRVALARALVIEPRLLLLDEPLGALDVSTKAAVRRELIQHLDAFGGARVIVTHDPLEAAALASRVVVMEAGRVVQEGTFAELTATPRTDYVASLVGTNLFRGRASRGTVVLANDAVLFVSAGPDTGPVLATVHPRAVVLSVDRPVGSARNAWPGRVTSIDSMDDRHRVTVDADVTMVAEITAAARHDLGLAPGSPVWASVKAAEIDVYPA